LFKKLRYKPCDAEAACQATEAWLDKKRLSTNEAFHLIWGCGPRDFLVNFAELPESQPEA
jgi:hypothetical protein